MNKNFAVSRKKLYNLLVRGWFKTRGRASRQEFVLRFLMMIFLGFFADFLFEIYNSNRNFLANIVMGMIAGFVFTPLFVLYVIQEFFLTHRRLHDLNASGWWQLILLIPFWQFILIGLLFFKGTDGPNRFGKEPEY